MNLPLFRYVNIHMQEYVKSRQLRSIGPAQMDMLTFAHVQIWIPPYTHMWTFESLYASLSWNGEDDPYRYELEGRRWKDNHSAPPSSVLSANVPDSSC